MSHAFSKTLKLIGLYLNQKEDPELIFEESDCKFLLSIGKNHSISAFLFKAVEASKASVSPEVKEQLNQAYLQNVRKSLFFQEERKELYAYLNENKISFIPLKGLFLKDCYLDPFEREFADNDILFQGEKSAALIKAFFKGRGYAVESYKRGNHDVYLKKPFLNFEMHRALFSKREDTAAFADFFSNPFSSAIQKQGMEYAFKDEDFYLYFLAHAFKHYDAGGAGIRMLLDAHLFLKGRTLDREYLKQGLEKLGLVEFEAKLASLSFRAFSGEELSEEEKKELLFIGKAGTYGTIENSVEKQVKKKGKFAYFMQRVFPPYSFYKEAYPWAYYSIILIPFAWLFRFFRILFRNPKKAASELKYISKAKKED